MSGVVVVVPVPEPEPEPVVVVAAVVVVLRVPEMGIPVLGSSCMISSLIRTSNVIVLLRIVVTDKPSGALGMMLCSNSTTFALSLTWSVGESIFRFSFAYAS